MAKEEYKDGCKFNPRGIMCKNHNECAHCGWNPEVEYKRKLKIREDIYKEENPYRGVFRDMP